MLQRSARRTLNLSKECRRRHHFFRRPQDGGTPPKARVQRSSSRSRRCYDDVLLHSNSGNEKKRPETPGATRRELSSRRGRQTAETIAPRAGYGNLAPIPTLANHARLRRLPGGGRSPPKPVSVGRIPCYQGKEQGISPILPYLRKNAATKCA